MTTPLPAISSRIEHRSPSGVPTVHITSEDGGAKQHFVAMQWLQPGERVFRHTHAVEETLIFLQGSGEVTIGDEAFSIVPESSLFVPAGERHGFIASASEGLCVVVVFPVPYFAETIFTGEDGPSDELPNGKVST